MRKEGARNFDILDMIFISGDERIKPWSSLAKKVIYFFIKLYIIFFFIKLYKGNVIIIDVFAYKKSIIYLWFRYDYDDIFICIEF